MDGNVLTISRGTWMELANLGFRQWEESRYLTTSDRHLGARQKRASVVNVARYYQDYVDIKGLRPHFRDSAEVTSVRRIDSVDGLWQVKGHIQTVGSGRF